MKRIEADPPIINAAKTCFNEILDRRIGPANRSSTVGLTLPENDEIIIL